MGHFANYKTRLKTAHQKIPLQNNQVLANITPYLRHSYNIQQWPHDNHDKVCISEDIFSGRQNFIKPCSSPFFKVRKT